MRAALYRWAVALAPWAMFLCALGLLLIVLLGACPGPPPADAEAGSCAPQEQATAPAAAILVLDAAADPLPALRLASS